MPQKLMIGLLSLVILRLKKRGLEIPLKTEYLTLALFVDYCLIEFDIDPKMKLWERVQEHLALGRHKKLKESHKKRVESNKQFILYETEVRQRQKEIRLLINL